MAMPSVLRSVQSDLVRDLARRAVDQGWDVYPTGGGHLAVVNPHTGVQVTLATSVGGGHATQNVRAAFRRAGLDLRSRAERRRSHRQEVRPVQVRDVTPAEMAPTFRPRPGAEKAGGTYRMVSREVLTIAGQEVRLSERADGAWVASYRSDDVSSGWRNYQDVGGRDAVLAKVRAALAPAEEPAPEPEPAPEEEPAPAPLPVVHDPGAFPLVAALDRLDRSLAPALEALEAAGKDDAAALLRAEVARTPLEAEALALYRRVMTGA